MTPEDFTLNTLREVSQQLEDARFRLDSAERKLSAITEAVPDRYAGWADTGAFPAKVRAILEAKP